MDPGALSLPRDEPPARKGGELRFLESAHLLRGLAAVLVVLEHSFSYGGRNLSPYLSNVVGSHGQIGVVIFFVISGFVLPYSLHARYELADYPKFLLRRLIRLEPVYLVGIITAVVMMWLQARFNKDIGDAWQPDAGRLLAHLLYLVPFTGYEWINVAFWTLAVEFQFYLLVGLLFPLLRRASPWQAILSILAISCGTFLATGHFTLSMHLPLFGLGALTYLFRTGRLRASWYLSGVVASCMLYACRNPIAWVLCGGAAALVIAWWNPPRMRIRFLGSISYPLYVIHWPVMVVVARIGRGQEEYLVWAASIVTASAAAFLVHLFIEKPTMRLARKIQY